MRFLPLDDAAPDEGQERVVQGHHALGPPGLDDRVDLERFPLPDEVGDGAASDQDLVRRHAPAPDPAAESLRDDARQRARQHLPDLVLPVRRKLVDDAVDR